MHTIDVEARRKLALERIRLPPVERTRISGPFVASVNRTCQYRLSR